jgi:hypothetical protein
MAPALSSHSATVLLSRSVPGTLSRSLPALSLHLVKEKLWQYAPENRLCAATAIATPSARASAFLSSLPEWISCGAYAESASVLRRNV